MSNLFCNNPGIITDYQNYSINVELYNKKINLLFKILLNNNISLITDNNMTDLQFNKFLFDINSSFINFDLYAFLLDVQGIYYAHGLFNINNNINLKNTGGLLCNDNINNLIQLLKNEINNPYNINNTNKNILIQFLQFFPDNTLLINAILNILQQSRITPKIVVYNWLNNTIKSTICLRLLINNKNYVLCI